MVTSINNKIAIVETSSNLFKKLLSLEKFTLLLPALAVSAVSHTLSPESNPNSPLSVKVLVNQHDTNKLIDHTQHHARINLLTL
jgi:hypothetical protein